MNNQNNITYLHGLIDAGLSLIPVNEGKKNPHWILGKTHDLLDRIASRQEVEHWVAAGVRSWGIASGEVSGNLAALDFEEKYQPGIYAAFLQKLSEEQKVELDKCAISRTRNKGVHVRYLTETPQPTTKLSMKMIDGKAETTSEVRADRSYALIPPSQGYEMIQGDLLRLPQLTDDMHKQFTDIMRTFDEVKTLRKTTKEYPGTQTVHGDRPGDRFNETASWEEILVPHGWTEGYKDHWTRPNKESRQGISATTNHEGRPLLYVFSSSAHPFQENTGYTKFHVYALLNHSGDFKAAARALSVAQGGTFANEGSEREERKGSMADRLVEIVTGREGVTLFHDEKMDAFVSVKIGEARETLSMKSKAIKRWLSKEFWDRYQKAPNAESVKGAISVLEGMACYEGPTYELHNRFAWKDGSLWYDLCDKEWRAIRIDSDGWDIVNDTPILFARNSHSRAQVLPSQDEGDVSLLLKYVNITDERMRMLLLVYLVTCFVPDFPHPIFVVFGPQGSAKSTLSKLLRRIIDPSLIEVASMPQKHPELVQALAHHAYLFFDNVSYITEQASDILCKAVTGSGFLKRELFTDDEDIIYEFKRCIGINGINLVTSKPDLLDRSLLIDLERIDDSKRKQEREIMGEFEKDLPLIMKGIMDALSATLRAKPGITIESLPRMADFALWGCAAAQALGYEPEEFMQAYQTNIDSQKDSILNENLIAVVLISFMEKRGWLAWEGTPTNLLDTLTHHANSGETSTRDKYWPKSPGALSRALNVLKATLHSAGISCMFSPGQERKIRIERFAKPAAAPSVQVAPEPEASDDNDDNDDNKTEHEEKAY